MCRLFQVSHVIKPTPRVMRRNKATRSGLDMSSTRFLLRKPCLPHQKHQTDLNFYSGASIRKGASIKYVRAEGEGGVLAQMRK